MNKILWLDPGKTTGYCLAYRTENTIYVACDEAELSMLEMYNMLRMAIEARVDIVGYETFEYRNVARTGLDLTPVKLIGVIELVEEGWNNLPTKFHRQTAAVGKAHYSDDKLKALELWNKGTKHGRDAMRHLLHWVSFYSPMGLEKPVFELSTMEWMLGVAYNGMELYK